MKKNKEKGIMGLFKISSLATASTLIAACSTAPTSFEDKKLSSETNNYYNESNFFGKVINVKEIENPKANAFSKNKMINEIVIEGDRGTIVTFKTKEKYQINDKVLFKSNKQSNIAEVIKVSDPTNAKPTNRYNQKPKLKNKEYYQDISVKHDPNLYIDKHNSPDIKKYGN